MATSTQKTTKRTTTAKPAAAKAEKPVAAAKVSSGGPVKLLSVKGRAQLIERFYFYDGEVPIVNGVIEIPANRPEWVQRAYIMGFRYDPETEAAVTLDEALSGTK